MIKAKDFRKKRRGRNCALGAFLALVSVLFYGITIVRF